MMKPFLGDVVMLGLDDTLARKRGLRMFGTGMHHDPSSSTRSLAFVRWGHSWVVLGIVVGFPFRPGHWIFLPLLFRLYLNRKSASKHGTHYRTRPELGIEMLHIPCSAHENSRFHVVADSAYGGQHVLARTCHEASAEQVIRWYAMRWSVEVTFRDSRQCLGFEEPRGWSRKAGERTAPLAMLLHTLVVLWFAKEGHRFWQPPTHRRYPAKANPSFADRLGAL
jgi:hypothetical protein